MADRILLIMCRRDGRYIAGALNFIGSDALYGRNWGCIEDHRFLHFEACYYQAIDFAISRGLQRVEAGAQGPHKVARGYVPQATYSAHWIADAGLSRRDRTLPEGGAQLRAAGHRLPERTHAVPLRSEYRPGQRFFSRSRISLSSTSSALGFGGSTGLAASFFFTAFIALISMKIANATITKSTIVWMNLP